MEFIGLAIAIFVGLSLYSAVWTFIVYKLMFNEKFMLMMGKKYIKFAEKLADLEFDED